MREQHAEQVTYCVATIRTGDAGRWTLHPLRLVKKADAEEAARLWRAAGWDEAAVLTVRDGSIQTPWFVRLGTQERSAQGNG